MTTSTAGPAALKERAVYLLVEARKASWAGADAVEATVFQHVPAADGNAVAA
ncbi:hypothetical protein [Streptomyces sp. MZ04]|uniref:hypothetical protein n=1 Tax=Streptomyces sp. MZ04 TaxID=2559236 RepID=UPI001432A885|nr:hypothetical protein [Streptomyces sp. MZ04]